MQIVAKPPSLFHSTAIITPFSIALRFTNWTPGMPWQAGCNLLQHSESVWEADRPQCFFLFYTFFRALLLAQASPFTLPSRLPKKQKMAPCAPLRGRLSRAAEWSVISLGGTLNNLSVLSPSCLRLILFALLVVAVCRTRVSYTPCKTVAHHFHSIGARIPKVWRLIPREDPELYFSLSHTRDKKNEHVPPQLLHIFHLFFV